jgi:hypothetical protein
VEVRDIHEGQLAGDAIERAWAERVETLGVIHDIRHLAPPRRTVVTSQAHHRLRRIRTDHLGRTGRCDRTAREALPASDVENDRIVEPRQEPEQALERGLMRAAAGLDELVVPNGDVRPGGTVLRVHTVNSRKYEGDADEA